MQLKTQKEIIKDGAVDSVMIYLLNMSDAKTELCGRSMTDWVKGAIKGFSYIEVDYDGSDVVQFIKPYLVNSKYSIILFSNTPLLTKASVMRIIDYVTFKGIKACKFTGGYAFEVNYVLSVVKPQFDSFLPIDNEDFLVADNASKIKYCERVLQDRIVSYHKSHGVSIGENVSIDADVEIGYNTMVFNNNIIKKHSRIGNNVILKENNVLENVSIADDSCVSGSTLINTTLEESVFVLPYCYIDKCVLRKNCYISSGVSLAGRTIRKGSKILKEN